MQQSFYILILNASTKTRRGTGPIRLLAATLPSKLSSFSTKIVYYLY